MDVHKIRRWRMCCVLCKHPEELILVWYLGLSGQALTLHSQPKLLILILMFWFVACRVKKKWTSYSGMSSLKMVVREPSLPYLFKASEIKQTWNSSYEISQSSDMYHKFVPWLFFTSYEWFWEVFIPQSLFQLIRFMNLPFKIKTMGWSQPSLHCTASSWEMKWKYSLVINRWTAYLFH